MNGRRNTMRRMPLFEAAWHFAPRPMRAQAQKERARPTPLLPRATFEDRRTQELADSVTKLSNSVGQFLEGLRDPCEPTPEMKRWLLQKLRSGQLEAFGVMTKPELGSGPEQIPTFMFNDRPRLGRASNIVENFGRKFEGVEIRRSVSPKAGLPNASTAAPACVLPKITAPERGRPTKTREIEQAIDGLIEQGVELSQLDRRRAIRKIKQFAREKLGAHTERGYSDPVLQRHLHRRFGRLP
jgi:hypothetical protein